MSGFTHIPVMLDPCMRCLNIKPGDVVVDGTLGGGGHTRAMLQLGARVIGIDRDAQAIAAASDKLASYGDRFTPVHGNFAQISALLDQIGVGRVSGVLLDLGVSSYQLDTPERGFSFHNDAPLDMRMDTGQPLTAAHVLNTYSQQELTHILRDYGEEKWAARIAQFILRSRPLHTTMDLVNVIDAAVPAAARRQVSHPARRSFQAIRIEVNGELSLLEGALDSAMERLLPGGRLTVITFHSLEDRIVKNTFRRMENPCVCPPKAPICTCGARPVARVITRKPLLPDAGEIGENPRSHSAKVRCAEHITETE